MKASGIGPAGIAFGGLAAFVAARSLWRSLGSYSFRGKVAMVTGGSRGLGLEIARELAQQGARVAVCARDVIELDRAATEFRQRDQPFLPLNADLIRKDHVESCVMRVIDQWGRIDVLVNNAGVIQTGPREEMTLDDYREAMDIHFWAPLHAIEAVLPGMKERREGRIVNISSIGGKISVPHLLPYCASKFALVGLSEGLRAELKQHGIVVTTVCPGLMRTGSPRNASFKGRHREEYAWFKISDSLPGISIDSRYAAKRILMACRRGEAEVMLSLPARLASMFHGVFPGAAADVLAWVNRILPEPGGVGTKSMRGAESESALSESLLTALTQRAAMRNNEIG